MSADRETSADQVRPKRDHARRIAFDVLSAYSVRGSGGEEAAAGAPHVTQLLDDRFAETSPPAVERRLAAELVYGIVRRRATVGALLAAYVTRPRASVEPGLWTLLEIGAYQLALMSGIAPHAAVNETVELAAQLKRPQWRGILNGVLRTISREIESTLTDIPASTAIPLADVQGGAGPASLIVRYRHVGREVFPSPSADPAGYVAAAFSFPRWLVDRWTTRWGADETRRLAAWFDTSGVLSLRVNPLRCSRDRLLKALAGAEIAASPGDHPACIRLGQSARIEELPGFAEGWFSVQDESAMHAGSLLAPAPGETILDLCAAPGGKTAHLAELMGNEGQIIACDINARRLERVRQTAERLQLGVIDTIEIAADGSDAPLGPFDAALVDVPCSNTGVLGKRPDVRWRIQPHDVAELRGLQRRLLTAAIAAVRPGGRIVYSTCSIEPDENEQIVQGALQAHPGLQLGEERRHAPGEPADGAYQALLRKS
jgi:16S rRNA (cytosine967-C5)-methyltransferase